MNKLINILKFTYLGLILVCLVSFVFLVRYTWGLILEISIVVLILVIYLLMHILRSITYSYKCPKCNHKFKINFIKDITAYNAAPGAKVLVCPKCGEKEVMKSVIEK